MKMLMRPSLPSPARRPSAPPRPCRTTREKPFSCRIFIAISSFVPVRRMTIGTLSGFAFVAVTMPFATSSVRVMPPKMLNRMTFTLGSAVMMRSAFTTFSGFDEPPMSRKLAGLAAVVLHQVHRRHREAGAVHDAADVAVELDEREVRVARVHLARRLRASRRAARRARAGDRARCRRRTIFASSASTSPCGRDDERVDLGERAPLFMNAV